MVRSSTVSMLLVLTFIVVNDVLGAPREERILDISKRKVYLQTREEEMTNRYARNVKFNKPEESREEEVMSLQLKRLENESPPSNETEIKEIPKKKATSVEKSNDISRASGESSEAKDMRESNVNPKDDDELPQTPKVSGVVPIADEKLSACVETVRTDNSTVKANCNNTAPLPADIFPDDDTVLNIADASEAIFKKFTHYDMINKSISANKSDAENVTVDVVSLPNVPINTTIAMDVAATAVTIQETSKSSITSVTLNATSSTTIPTSSTTTKPTTVSTTAETPVTTVNSEKNQVITEKPMTSNIPEESKSAEMTGLHALRDDKPTSMPSGVVALITAIAFAVVAVMAYISLVAWRRYLEWRYGNRELLVNDFDANDMSNFEL